MELIKILELVLNVLVLGFFIWLIFQGWKRARKEKQPVFRVMYMKDKCVDLPDAMPDPQVGDQVTFENDSVLVTGITHHCTEPGRYFQMTVHTKPKFDEQK